jgi:hypothetical protein
MKALSRRRHGACFAVITGALGACSSSSPAQAPAIPPRAAAEAHDAEEPITQRMESRIDRVLGRELVRAGDHEPLPVAIWIEAADPGEPLPATRARVRQRLAEEAGVSVEDEVDGVPLLLVRATRRDIARILRVREVGMLCLYEVERADAPAR